MEVARQRLADVQDELTGLSVAGGEDGSAEARAEREEREAITAAMQAIGTQPATTVGRTAASAGPTGWSAGNAARALRP